MNNTLSKCLSDMRPGGFPKVDKCPEITTPVAKYVSLANIWISFLSRSERS